jgi:predicted secreted protein
MANPKKGIDFLLKDGTASGGTTIAEMRATSFTINGSPVDVTNKGSSGYRTLLAGAGVTSMSVSASGVLGDDDIFTTLNTRCLTKTLNAYGLVFSDTDYIDASFQVTSVTMGGVHDGEQTWEITLESSGTITQTAA